ncbi:hypothetical protein [Pseudoxanthomonas sp. CF125]|nr:hypothetical protein [Pseudoxanthomonas sp. CF125]
METGRWLSSPPPPLYGMRGGRMKAWLGKALKVKDTERMSTRKVPD